MLHISQVPVLKEGNLPWCPPSHPRPSISLSKPIGTESTSALCSLRLRSMAPVSRFCSSMPRCSPIGSARFWPRATCVSGIGSPGFTGSSRATPPLSIADQASHARLLLAHLGISRAHVVGHSSGGCIALQLALDAPDLVQSLALLEPVVASGPLADEFGRTVVGPAFGRYAAGDRAGAADLFLQGVGGPEYRTLVAQTLGASALEQLERDVDTFFQVEGPAVNAWQFGPAMAAHVQPPVLLLVGGVSRPVCHEGHERLLEWAPVVQGLVVPGANHLLPLQQPHALGETLAGFFARQPIAMPR